MEPKHPPEQHGQLSGAQEAQDLRWFRQLEEVFPVIYHRVRNLAIDYAHDIHPDLDAAGYVVLAQIRFRAPIRAAQLVELLAIDKGAISRQVRLLLDLKLIDRMTDPNDSRASLLLPTEEGMRRVDQSQSARLRRFQATLPQLAGAFESLFTTWITEEEERREE